MAKRKYISLKELHKQLEEEHFDITQKSLEQLINTYKIPSFPMDGRLSINLSDWESRNEFIQDELAQNYATGKNNISQGQLRAKAIARGIFRCITTEKNSFDINTLLKYVQAEFDDNKSLGTPFQTTNELLDYLKALLISYDKSHKINRKRLQSSPQSSTASIETTQGEQDRLQIVAQLAVAEYVKMSNKMIETSEETEETKKDPNSDSKK